MNNIIKTSLLITLLIAMQSLSSCSKCYECTRLIEVEVDKDGDGVPEIELVEDTDDICTANKKDVDNKENEGWSCS